MIKKYNQYIKESLLDKLEGPSEKDFMDTFYTLTPYQFLSNSINQGYLKGVEFALSRGIQVFDKPELLNDAVKSGEIEIVKLLIKNQIGKSSLFNSMLRATKDNKLEILKLLYNYGSEYLFKTVIINSAYEGLYNMNLVDSAINFKAIECLKFLLENGVSCNIRDDGGVNQLKMSIISYNEDKDYLEIINLLIKYGFPITEDVIKYAEKNSDDTIVNLLKDKYDVVKESLLNKLEGPSKDEVLNNIKNYENQFDALLKCVSLGLQEGIDYIVKTNPNDTKIQGFIGWYKYIQKWFSDTMKLTTVIDYKNVDIKKGYTNSNDTLYYIHFMTHNFYLVCHFTDGEETYYYNYDIFYEKISNDNRFNWKQSEMILKGLTKYYLNETPDYISFSTFEELTYKGN